MQQEAWEHQWSCFHWPPHPQGWPVLLNAAAETVRQVKKPGTGCKAAMGMPASLAGLLRLAAVLCWLLGSVKRLALPTPQRNMSIPLDILGCTCRPCMHSPGLDRSHPTAA